MVYCLEKAEQVVESKGMFVHVTIDSMTQKGDMGAPWQDDVESSLMVRNKMVVRTE